MAARHLKWLEAPVSFQNYESDEQEYADVQSDNAIASWAELDLSGINFDLQELGPDFNIDLLGIKNFVLEPADKAQCDEDEVPEHVEPKTKLGDLYQLGRHRLLCGDSAATTDLDRLLSGEPVDAVISDPPYGINWDTDYTRFTGGVADTRKNSGRIANDSEEFDPLPWLIYDSVVLFGANYFAKNLPVGTWLIWDKRFKNGEAFLSDAEMAWMKGGTGVYIQSITSQGFVRPEKINHPTQKPVDLMVWCMEKAKAGNVVLEPYAGSGTTLLACEKTNRKCFAVEIEPKYCDVIVARFERYSGQKAELIDATEASSGPLAGPALGASYE